MAKSDTNPLTKRTRTFYIATHVDSPICHSDTPLRRFSLHRGREDSRGNDPIPAARQARGCPRLRAVEDTPLRLNWRRSGCPRPSAAEENPLRLTWRRSGCPRPSAAEENPLRLNWRRSGCPRPALRKKTRSALIGGRTPRKITRADPRGGRGRPARQNRAGFSGITGYAEGSMLRLVFYGQDIGQAIAFARYAPICLLSKRLPNRPLENNALAPGHGPTRESTPVRRAARAIL